jgi:hypothetical protein
MTNKVAVPVPGPARLKKSAGPDEWLEAAKNCKYLSEYHMKQLCEIVKEFMMEGQYDRPAQFQLTNDRRIKHPAGCNTSHNLRRHPWPIL